MSGVDGSVAGSEDFTGVCSSLIGGGGDEGGGGGLARWGAVEVVGGGVATLEERSPPSVTSPLRRGVVGVRGTRGDCEASGTNMMGGVKRPS
jgi:hypothetical protein